MKKTLLSLLGAAFAFTGAMAQCGSTGTGVDGAYNATSSSTLAGGTYNYTTFNISAGATVTVTGSQPLVIYCTGAATINGSLLANGQNGNNGVTYSNAGTGGMGVAGGGNGGNGTYASSSGPIAGMPGTGPGALTNAGGGWSGGGGAGYATAGVASGSSSGGFGGAAYGTPQISGTDAGSGGGGGSGGYECGAGGGGGGGGYITIQATSITIGATGVISVNGGNGGSDGTGNCGGGGGGSGGSIWLAAPSMTHNGVLTATGGLGGASNVPGNPYYGEGGNGADGRIRLDYANALAGTGTSTPAVGYTGNINAVQTAAVVTQNVSCFGGSDGAALATNMNGNGPYTSSWSPSGGNSTTATGLTAGSYTYTVTDANGCIATATVNITEPPQITATITATDVLCFGGSSGSASVTATGGTPPYTYNWIPFGGTQAAAYGLPAGCYQVDVTDANGCVITESICIIEPPQIQLTTTVMNVTCFNSCDGMAAVSAIGGTGSYTYLWTPGGETTASISSLCAGCYTITVTDANGCTATETVCITQPVPPTPGFLGNDTLLCDSASIMACVPPGNASYMWSTGATTQCINISITGCYIVMVTDPNGCTSSDTICVTVTPCLGTDERNTDALSIYPNPAANSIRIVHGMSSPQPVQITDMRGSIVIAESVSNNEEIDLSRLAEGVYTISVNGSQQRLVITR
jgi:hypothetical protein